MKLSASKFAKETDLCAHFLGGIKKGWTAFAETAGWDILLVREKDGFQIGIEAKLRLNAEVLCQAAEGAWDVGNAGPDCRAVLVPFNSSTGGLGRLAAYIGITIIGVFQPTGCASYGGRRFDPSLPEDDIWRSGQWFEWCPRRRHALPEYVPDVAAGASSPIRLTKWKIAAIKILVTIEKRGFVTRMDFKHHGIDHRRWICARGWLDVRGGHYVACHRTPALKTDHPLVYAQIAAEADKWLPTTVDGAAGPLL